jgi:uncharacterized protein YggE
MDGGVLSVYTKKYKNMEKNKQLMYVGGAVAAFSIAACALMGALYLGKSASFVGSSPATSIITVTGKGEISKSPDIATLVFTVREKAKTVADAQKSLGKISDDVVAKMKALGVAEKDIKTENYSSYPEYDYGTPCYSGVVPCSAKPTLIGYEVSETITVKVRSLDSVEKILAAAGEAGISEISGPNFEVDEVEKVRDEARDKAIADAKEKAEVLAKSLGVSLVRITSYNENNGGYGRPFMMMAKAMDSGVSNESAGALSPGENKITSEVTISYEIK